jgi:hypothetical protein
MDQKGESETPQAMLPYAVYGQLTFLPHYCLLRHHSSYPRQRCSDPNKPVLCLTYLSLALHCLGNEGGDLHTYIHTYTDEI